mmetsp:Transcript_120192/g.212468  ORF Transcript_120192/g.212468 Transcript_120192/m.212468 type:complete len:157 (-) Transcript_120192:1138-1608(-)
MIEAGAFGAAADAAVDNPVPSAGHQPVGCRRAAGEVPAPGAAGAAAERAGSGRAVDRAGSGGAGDRKPLPGCCGCRSEEAESCGARSCGDKIFPGRRPELLAVSASSRTPVVESTVRAVVCAEAVLASTPLLNLRAGVEGVGLAAASGVAAGAKRL